MSKLMDIDRTKTVSPYSKPERTNPPAPRERTQYDGKELQRPPGVGPARFVAFELPSRRGNKLYYPNGDVRCVTD
jgi:hypothetical protein